MAAPNGLGVRRFRTVVLCYHAASASWPHLLSLPPREIERQIRNLLRRRLRPATAAEAAARPGERLLAVTFDDAFRSVADALPALERLGVPVTIFVCSGLADGGRPLAVPELAGELVAYPGELETMDWDTLRGLAERGVEIGSHTVSHRHLLELTDTELARELTESRRRIEAELGHPCRILAYPFGEEDGRCRAAARTAGYEAAFTLPRLHAPAESRRPDPYAVPRIGLFLGDGLVRTALKTTPLVQRVAAAVDRLR